MHELIEKPRFDVPREIHFRDPPFYRNVFWLLYIQIFPEDLPRRRYLDLMEILYDYPGCFFEISGKPFIVVEYLNEFPNSDPGKWFQEIRTPKDELETEPAYMSTYLHRVRLVYAACLAHAYERDPANGLLPVVLL